MASIAPVVSTPVEIDTFFTNLYRQSPQVSQEKKKTVYSLKGADELYIVTDKYRGCYIEIGKIEKERLPFVRDQIATLGEAIRRTNSYDSLWVNLPLPINPTLLSVLPETFSIGIAGKGDLVRDDQEKKIKFWQWLNLNEVCAIPAGATHNIGATALLCDTTARKVLLVVNQMRKEKWNLPGGSFNPGQDKNPAATALREAMEEGGFKIDPAQIEEPVLIGQSQFPENQFAPAISQIWFFAMKGISEAKLNPPPKEILRAEWISYEEILGSKDGTLRGLKMGEEIREPLNAAINGLGIQKIADKGFMVVHSSVYKGPNG